MKKYNFYNKEYGIKLQLTLDEEKKELIYQCAGIGDEYRGKFNYQCKNEWAIRSMYGPAIGYSDKELWLRGFDRLRNDDIVIVNNKGYYIINNVKKNQIEWLSSCRTLKHEFHSIIEALEELGNDSETDQGLLFLDM